VLKAGDIFAMGSVGIISIILPRPMYQVPVAGDILTPANRGMH
jgi:hypothetical protein